MAAIDIENDQETIKVLLADDHQVMREGLRRIIDEENDLMTIAEAADGMEALQLARETVPDVIVMDINMPKMNGIDATQQIKEELPEIQIVGLSFYDDKEVKEDMRNAGASAYLSKTEASGTLCETIRREAGGSEQ
jgi:DNA-binding NarL/FixJ family response regulator